MIEGSAPTTGRSADVPETQTDGLEVLETREWLDSLDYVLYKGGPDRAGRLLQQLSLHARRQAGVNLPFTATTPYQNTIAARQQPPFPGSQEMERRIKSLVRWNALAWWCGRIRCKRASADIFLPLHRPQPCTKLHSIIFFMQKRKAAIVTSFIFRAMLLRACTPARIWKAAFRAKNWKTSDAN